MTAPRAASLWKWSGISVLLGVVLWIPPVIDEIAHSPGNLSVIRDYFSHPPDSPIGFGRGVGVLFSQLNPWSLLADILVHDGGGLEVTGSRVPGAILLIAFAASLIGAWRLRHRVLLALDAVLVVALALGLISSARIFGTVWFYLLLWAWALCALILFAIGWTVVELVRARDANAARFARVGSAVLIGVIVVSSVAFAVQARNVTVQTPRLNETLGAVVGPTATALDHLEAKGQKGPYLVTWLPDAEAIGSAGYGLLNELDRRGFDVRGGRGVPARSHPLPRDRQPHANPRSAPRDRRRHRELETRPALQGSRVVRSPVEGGTGDVRGAARPGRQPVATGEPGQAGKSGRRQPLHARDRRRRTRIHAPAGDPDARSEHADGGLHRPACGQLSPTRMDPSVDTGPDSKPADTTRDPRWFRPALWAIVAGALVLRVTYVMVSRRNFDPQGDAFFYHAAANLLVDGKGFISPFLGNTGIHRQAAEHPPLYIIFLAIPSLLGMKSVMAHLLWSCLLGTATVGLIGLLGRAVGGARVGVIAAFIAAVYPNLWAPDGMIQAETLSMFATAGTLLFAYRYWQRPSWRRLVLVGIACAFGALARSELILLIPLLVLPLACLTRDRSWKVRVQWLGASVLAAAIVIAPWTIYNTTRFVHPVLLSAQIDPLLASANCDSTYYGGLQGYFDINCAAAIAKKNGLTLKDDESQENLVYRREAFAYVRAHLSRVPTVEAVRLLRIVGLYRTGFYVRADATFEGRRPIWISWAALYSFWVLALLAIGAIVIRRTRRAIDKSARPPLYPLLMPIIVVVITVLVTYASTRFRTTAEPSLVVLAALAIDGAIRDVQHHSRSATLGSSGTCRRV